MVKHIPYGLVAMSVVFSIFGMIDMGLHWAQIVALAALHLCFVILLANTLEAIIDESKNNVPKAFTLGILGFAFTVFDVWLVHFGLALMLTGWNDLGVYLASTAFAVVNIFAKWAYTPTEIEEKTEAEHVGQNIAHLNKVMR